MRRKNNGQYAINWSNHFKPLLTLISSLLLTFSVQQVYKQEKLISPCEGDCEFFIASAYEEPKTIENEVVETPQTIIDERPYASIVLKYFGEDHFESAMKIMHCESRYNPETVGDTHIMSINQETGELIGDSIGLFQVRTGSHDWNRAARNGMTADEFRAWLKVPENNIKYAKDIFDRRGWAGWFNCMNKVL